MSKWLGFLLSLGSLAPLSSIVLASSTAAPSLAVLHTEHSCKSLDPRRALVSSCRELLINLYDNLAAIDKSGHIVPSAAKSWQLDHEARRIRFELHTDRQWSDGQAVTAQDFITSWTSSVKASLKQNTHLSNLMKIKGAHELVAGEADTLAGLSSPNPYTLVVEFEQFDPLFHLRTSHASLAPIPHHAYQQHGDDWAYQDKPPLNGRYQATQTAAHYRLTPNPYHPESQELPIQEVHATRIDAHASFQATKQLRDLSIHQDKRTADYVRIREISNSIRSFATQHQLRLEQSNLKVSRAMIVNVNRLSELEVNTFKCAISTEEYVSRNKHETLDPTHRFVHLPQYTLPPISHAERLPDDCKALLAKQLEQKSDTPKRILINTYLGESAIKSVDSLQAMLLPYGFVLEVKRLSIQDYADQQARGDYDVSLFGWPASVFDPSGYFRFTRIANGWITPEARQAFEQKAHTASLLQNQARFDAYTDAEKFLLKHSGLIPLAISSSHYLARQNLCGLQEASSIQLIAYHWLYWCDSSKPKNAT